MSAATVRRRAAAAGCREPVFGVAWRGPSPSVGLGRPVAPAARQRWGLLALVAGAAGTAAADGCGRPTTPPGPGLYSEPHFSLVAIGALLIKSAGTSDVLEVPAILMVGRQGFELGRAD